jgi:hypothetical protein
MLTLAQNRGIVEDCFQIYLSPLISITHADNSAARA